MTSILSLIAFIWKLANILRVPYIVECPTQQPCFAQCCVFLVSDTLSLCSLISTKSGTTWNTLGYPSNHIVLMNTRDLYLLSCFLTILLLCDCWTHQFIKPQPSLRWQDTTGFAANLRQMDSLTTHSVEIKLALVTHKYITSLLRLNFGGLWNSIVSHLVSQVVSQTSPTSNICFEYRSFSMNTSREKVR